MNFYECNICLETARDAVVSRCGHLFCWPCLHQWFLTRPQRTRCPVCRAPANKDNVIPIYGGNNTEDPRNKFPPRGFWLSRIRISITQVIQYCFLFLCCLLTCSHGFEYPRQAGDNHGTTPHNDKLILWKCFILVVLLAIRGLIFA
ncbi:hypothetical protein KR038_008779 [Drosophila bunnanda]|nr:hypothetical protein KR038_008779 [Drosophila bunnanda]